MKYIGMIFGVLLRDKYIIQLGAVMTTVKLHNIYAIILLGIIVNIFLLDWIHSILLLSMLTKKTWTLMSYHRMLNVFSQHHTWIQFLLHVKIYISNSYLKLYCVNGEYSTTVSFENSDWFNWFFLIKALLSFF